MTKSIEILFFEGCPNHAPAVDAVREVVDQLGVDARIRQVEITTPEDAQRLRFLGSPSIRVDGVDIEPDARTRTDFGFSCRTYNGVGLPSRDLIHAAIEGGGDTANRPGVRAASGAIVAAALASACCWLPLMLVAAGLSAGGIGMLFEKTRPVFLAVTALLLAFAAYRTYRPRTACADDAECAQSARRGSRKRQALLGVLALGAFAFAAFPSYVGVFFPESNIVGAATDDASVPEIALRVDGMSCEACSRTIEHSLNSVPGVRNATVSYELGLARVALDPTAPASVAFLIKTIEDSGYTAEPIDNEQPK